MSTVYPGIGLAASGPYGLLNGHVGIAFNHGVTLEVFDELLTNKQALTNRLINGLGFILLET